MSEQAEELATVKSEQTSDDKDDKNVKSPAEDSEKEEVSVELSILKIIWMEKNFPVLKI